ncbi:MAG: TlpA family protein disulfide reductase [Burkholderiales bacterium]|nr:TlpA family protein disulfide reductase [Burkholderiales bacterium]
MSRCQRSRALYLQLLCIAVTWFTVLAADAFDLKDTAGQSQRLSDLKGKWVVVNFWATWCAPCVKEIPDIAEFAKDQGEKVRVVGIALDWVEGDKPTAADDRKIKAFAKKVGHTYPLVLGNAATEKFFGKVKGLPKTIIYAPDGKVVFEKTGPVTRQLLARVVAGEKI